MSAGTGPPSGTRAPPFPPVRAGGPIIGTPTVANVMTIMPVQTPVTVAADEPDLAVALMGEHKVRRLPVTADGVAVGIVSLGGLAEYAEPGSVRDAISAAEPNH